MIPINLCLGLDGTYPSSGPSLLIKNRVSFILPNYLKTNSLVMDRKLLCESYLFISINMGLSGTRAKVYRALIEWRVQPQDSSRLIKLTQKQDLVKLI